MPRRSLSFALALTLAGCSSVLGLDEFTADSGAGAGGGGGDVGSGGSATASSASSGEGGGGAGGQGSGGQGTGGGGQGGGGVSPPTCDTGTAAFTLISATDLGQFVLSKQESALTVLGTNANGRVFIGVNARNQNQMGRYFIQSATKTSNNGILAGFDMPGVPQARFEGRFIGDSLHLYGQAGSSSLGHIVLNNYMAGPSLSIPTKLFSEEYSFKECVDDPTELRYASVRGVASTFVGDEWHYAALCQTDQNGDTFASYLYQGTSAGAQKLLATSGVNDDKTLRPTEYAYADGKEVILTGSDGPLGQHLRVGATQAELEQSRTFSLSPESGVGTVALALLPGAAQDGFALIGASGPIINNLIPVTLWSGYADGSKLSQLGDVPPGFMKPVYTSDDIGDLVKLSRPATTSKWSLFAGVSVFTERDIRLSAFKADGAMLGYGFKTVESLPDGGGAFGSTAIASFDGVDFLVAWIGPDGSGSPDLVVRAKKIRCN